MTCRSQLERSDEADLESSAPDGERGAAIIHIRKSIVGETPDAETSGTYQDCGESIEASQSRQSTGRRELHGEAWLRHGKAVSRVRQDA